MTAEQFDLDLADGLAYDVLPLLPEPQPKIEKEAAFPVADAGRQK
jgi:hypothetical protein